MDLLDQYKISKTNFTKEEILRLSQLSDQLLEDAQCADILILPGHSDFEPQGIFRDGTLSFYKYSKKNLSDYKVCIVEDPQKIKSENLRSAEIWIPILFFSYEFVKSVGSDFVAQLVINYVEKIRGKSKDPTRAHLKIVLGSENGDVPDQIDYDGPAEGLKELPKIIGKMRLK